jgi:hypothetical protein
MSFLINNSSLPGTDPNSQFISTSPGPMSEAIMAQILGPKAGIFSQPVIPTSTNTTSSAVTSAAAQGSGTDFFLGPINSPLELLNLP